jgi:PAS domain S-box-containing protein
MQSDNNASPIPNAELERERLISLINSMADGVIAIDEACRVVAYNGAALNIMDLNSSMNGKDLSTLLHLLDKDKKPLDLKLLITNSKTAATSRDYLLKYNDNSTINVYFSIAPVHLGFGKAGARGHVILLRDITREKSLEEERDEFISVVSHELRTPVAIAEGNISNAQYVADRTQADPQIKDALKQSYTQIMFLSNLINDLSTLSRAERGVLTVDIEDINVHELAEELVKGYAEQAAAKGLQIHTELDPHLEIVRSSKLYVREILQNFVTNAIKYTPKGSVTLAAFAKPAGVLFEVRDTGIGISVGDQRKLFGKFFRAEDPRTQKESGTGLGLYVTLKLSKLIGAELDVHSELNQGSTFSIYVPNLNLPTVQRPSNQPVTGLTPPTA